MSRAVLSRVASLGADPRDDSETRLQKSLLVASTVMIAVLSIAWGLLYLAFGERLAASIPLGYSALSFLSLAVFAKTRRYAFFRASQLLLMLLLPFFLMLALGGFVASSAVILWAITSPLGALLFAGRRQAVRWFLAYLALVALGALAEPFGRPASGLPPTLHLAFFALNVGGVSAVIFVLVQYFVRQKAETLQLLQQEQDKSEQLLLNILPKDIARILKDEQRVVADGFDSASVLFADVVNFTPMSAQMTPRELVALLDEVFTHFDALAEELGVEKIKTIGDCYMVAAGVPRPRADHAHVLARMALRIQRFAAERDFSGRKLAFRIGLNTGPVVAGVIGRKKFIYDLWGDAVNTASRMESHGVAGTVQITEATHALIKDAFVCEPRGAVQVKGKGEMQLWQVLAERT